MEKKSFLKIGGAMLLMAIVLNIQYAWGDYGVKDNPLHLEVLAQGNDTGDGKKDNMGDGTGHLWKKTVSECIIEVGGQVGDEYWVYDVLIKIPDTGHASVVFKDASTSCAEGGFDYCSRITCYDFRMKMDQACGTIHRK